MFRLVFGLGGLFPLNRVVHLPAVDRDVLRSGDAETDLIPSHVNYRDFNVVTNDYRLVLLSTSYTAGKACCSGVRDYAADAIYLSFIKLAQQRPQKARQTAIISSANRKGKNSAFWSFLWVAGYLWDLRIARLVLIWT
jgi:hypothetical protein